MLLSSNERFYTNLPDYFLLWAASTLAVWLFGLTQMLCFLLCIEGEYIKKNILINGLDVAN